MYYNEMKTIHESEVMGAVRWKESSSFQSNIYFQMWKK